MQFYEDLADANWQINCSDPEVIRMRRLYIRHEELRRCLESSFLSRFYVQI